MFVYTIELDITFIITLIIISAIEGHTMKKLISVHDVIFHFGISRYSILDFFCFGNIDIPCYLLELFIHVQDVNDITASYGRFVCLLLVLFGFSFLVVIEIGSQAHFTCFSNVDLSCIFWSISNPFFQNTVSSLLMCFSSSLWNIFQ